MARLCCGASGTGGSFACADLNSCSINSLADVNINGIADGEGIAWNAAVGTFVPSGSVGGACSFELMGVNTATAITTVTAVAGGATIEVDVIGGGGGGVCSFELEGGPGINISGTGAIGDPAVVTNVGTGIQEFAWNDTGPVFPTSTSPRSYALTDLDVFEWLVSLDTPATSVTTVELRSNGTTIDTINVPAGSNFTSQNVTVSVTQGSYLQVFVTSGDGSGRNLGAQVAFTRV